MDNTVLIDFYVLVSETKTYLKQTGDRSILTLYLHSDFALGGNPISCTRLRLTAGNNKRTHLADASPEPTRYHHAANVETKITKKDYHDNSEAAASRSPLVALLVSTALLVFDACRVLFYWV